MRNHQETRKKMTLKWVNDMFTSTKQLKYIGSIFITWFRMFKNLWVYVMKNVKPSTRTRPCQARSSLGCVVLRRVPADTRAYCRYVWDHFTWNGNNVHYKHRGCVLKYSRTTITMIYHLENVHQQSPWPDMKLHN